MQRNENLVDLENPEKMSIWSLSELSIQPRTSLLKFEGDSKVLAEMGGPLEQWQGKSNDGRIATALSQRRLAGRRSLPHSACGCDFVC